MRRLKFSLIAAAVVLHTMSAVVVAAQRSHVLLDEPRQRFLGVGGALTHSSAYLLQNAADQAAAQALIEDLVGSPRGCTANASRPCRGAGLTVLRLPIGTSDFGVTDFFSFDDMPAGEADWNLTYFSTARDEAYFVPALQRVLSVMERDGVEPFIIAAPWSAPGWLKTTGTILGGALRADDPRVIETYARYFVRYVDAYRTKYGVKVRALSLQNEPWNSNPSYPTMILTPQQEAELVVEVDRLLTEYEDAMGIPASERTELWLWDHNWLTFYAEEVFGNLTAHAGTVPARVVGTAFHCYDGSIGAQSQVHDAAPAGHQRVFFTECSGGTWSPDFNSDLTWDVQTLIAQNTQNWGETVLKWNLVLDSTGGPKVEGGCMTCRGVATLSLNNDTTGSSSGVTVYNEDYYSLAHAGAFVRRGDAVLRVHDDSNRTTAFRSLKDGSVVIVTANPSVNETRAFAFCLQRSATSAQPPSCTPYVAPVLPPQSVATAVVDMATLRVSWWLTVGSDPTVRVKEQTSFSLVADQ